MNFRNHLFSFSFSFLVFFFFFFLTTLTCYSSLLLLVQAQQSPPATTTYLSSPCVKSNVGSTFTHLIAKAATTGTIYGDLIYTSDSDLETAVVHSGIMSAGTSGSVQIICRQGLSSYPGSLRNGVQSWTFPRPSFNDGAYSVLKANGDVIQLPKLVSTRWMKIDLPSCFVNAASASCQSVINNFPTNVLNLNRTDFTLPFAISRIESHINETRTNSTHTCQFISFRVLDIHPQHLLVFENLGANFFSSTVSLTSASSCFGQLSVVPSSPSPPSSTSDDDDALTPAEIVGIIFLVLVAIAIIVAGIWWMIKSNEIGIENKKAEIERQSSLIFGDALVSREQQEQEQKREQEERDQDLRAAGRIFGSSSSSSTPHKKTKNPFAILDSGDGDEETERKKTGDHELELLEVNKQRQQEGGEKELESFDVFGNNNNYKQQQQQDPNVFAISSHSTSSSFHSSPQLLRKSISASLASPLQKHQQQQVRPSYSSSSFLRPTTSNSSGTGNSSPTFSSSSPTSSPTTNLMSNSASNFGGAALDHINANLEQHEIEASMGNPLHQQHYNNNNNNIMNEEDNNSSSSPLAKSPSLASADVSSSSSSSSSPAKSTSRANFLKSSSPSGNYVAHDHEML